MTSRDSQAQSSVSRRRFLQRSSLAVAATAAASEFAFTKAVHADGPELEIKIGLIGCGGRGTGALLDALGAATKIIYPNAGYHTEDVAQNARLEKKGIKVVALADLFDDRLARCAEQLEKLEIKIPKEMRFVGIDAYKQLLAVPEINYVIFATPPHFRPMHVRAAIEAGKHVFIEKPVAVDAPGVRAVIEAGLLAKQKGLGIAAGTQRRHTNSYQETIKRIQGRRDRRAGLRPLLLGRQRNLGDRAKARVDRHGMAAPQLALFHLAFRRSLRRATHSQHRRDELGVGRPSHQGRWPPSAGARSARPRNMATSTTISPSSSSIPTTFACSARPARRTAATTSPRRPSSARSDRAIATKRSSRRPATVGVSAARR